MKNFITKTAFLLFLVVATATYSQEKLAIKKDSIKAKDSLNTALLTEYNSKIAQIEKQRIQDSVKRAGLESKLNSLKTTDNLKKEALLKQIEELNNQDRIRIEKKKAQIDALRSTAKAYPVKGFFDDTLFLIYSKLGSFSASDRADAISNRVQQLADHFTFTKDSLKIVPSETVLDITYGEKIIMSISENDAIWNGSSKEALAQKYQSIIANSVSHYKNETSTSTLIKEVGTALLILSILAIVLFYINRFFNWTALNIEGKKGNRLKGFTIKNYTLFDEERQVSFVLFLNKLLKWIVNLVLIYVTLPVLFGIFPWTKNFANTLFGYVLTPLKNIGLSIWNYLPNLITIIVIYFVFHYVLKGIEFLKEEIAKGNLQLTNFYPEWANPTYQIIRVLLYAFMFVLIFKYLPGSDSPIFQGVSVFLGFLFTFGSSGALSNVIAGIVLTYMRLFKIGDRVKIGDITGNVIEKSLLVTRIKTIKNEIISIPNSTVMNSHTTNYTSETLTQGLIIHTTITIGYDVPWKTVHQALLNAADRTNLLLKEPKPFVLQTSLDDFYVSYQINAHTKDANKQAIIYSDLHQNIQDCCNELGIEILSPHYRAARDGNRTTIPESYLPQDYQTPSFNVNMDKK
ncbi:mechanosensitive ion channel [Flavobacterium sp. NG2]|uniref:mechanosensitive ion channel domain-containing protein n=1 Tax=Flavobacterium sp. NG2 TaxID=3097547 RepID=UPI002A7F103A|nr:mechanosensitive ion channel domain-containing protein [Flavobacterium sp. NG2]WPR70266.1 mechanosensitive ion channel [Flavobacterium sp. NG2]